jgi:rubrerythrin
MSAVFSGGDLINIAIDIERRGIMFYDIMAKSSDNEDTRAVFEELVEMEREHIRMFEDMLVEADNHQPRGELSPGQSDYLRALIDDAVFTDDAITSEMAAQADNDIKALELAISAEKDSMLFYYEIKDIMPGNAVTMINRIIAEEKMHLQQLSDIKRKLAAS